MGCVFKIFCFFSVVTAYPLFAPGQGGYHEWHDELNDYNFQEPQFHDVVPITPYEDPNPVYYDFSPYLDPHAIDHMNPQ